MTDTTPDITVYGAPWCPDCRRSKKFLAEQRVPYRWVDIDADAEGRAEVERRQKGGRTIPTIVFGDGTQLLEPSNQELATKLGLTLRAARGAYDLAIVGGGPAGLAAAIYAAREGIDAIVIERSGLGGQAGVTERIDNYPGFPDGVRGGELAERFIAQARRYEVELLSAVAVDDISPDGDDLSVRLSTGQELAAHAVLLAPGTSYRRLDVAGEDDLIGAGIHFCATCDGPFYRGAEELLVIGGGNSALEEGLFLAQFATRIRIVQVGPELTASRLLQDKIRSHDQFVVHTSTRVTAFHGQNRLDSVDLTSGDKQWSVSPAAAFVFIGLDPNTDFVAHRVDRDAGRFILDSAFATSMPGVFVAGDARAGSTKQLGSAVGDGIAALISIRRYLEEHHHVGKRQIAGTV